mgnify:CR=1 FL=1
MNIEGLSETTLEKFLTLGYLQTFPDIYHLNEHQEEILISWKVSVKNPLKDYGIPLLPAVILPLSDSWFPWIFLWSDEPKQDFGYSIPRQSAGIFDAASGDYDFTQLDDFGDTLNQNIHDWFSDEKQSNSLARTPKRTYI